MIEKAFGAVFTFFCGLVRILVIPVSRTRLALVLWGREAGDAEDHELHRVEARRRDGAWILDGRDYGLEAGRGPSFGRRCVREGGVELLTDGFGAWSNEDVLAVPGDVLELLALAAAEGWPIRHVLSAEHRYEDGDSGMGHELYAVGPGRGIHISMSCVEYGMGWNGAAKAVTVDEFHREMGKLVAWYAAEGAQTPRLDERSGALRIAWTDRPAEEAQTGFAGGDGADDEPPVSEDYEYGLREDEEDGEEEAPDGDDEDVPDSEPCRLACCQG